VYLKTNKLVIHSIKSNQKKGVKVGLIKKCHLFCIEDYFVEDL
jgi:hypothetical protein